MSAEIQSDGPADGAQRRDSALRAAGHIPARLQDLASRTHVPGIAWGVVLDGELVAGGGVGELAAGSGQRPDVDSVFRIASMTKSFTAAAIVLLRDRGLLGLDDPLQAHVPEAAAFAPPGGDTAPISIRDLLTMSAGWPQDDPWADRQLYRDDRAMSALYAAGASFSGPPGIAYEYSNLGYMLLGRIISNVCGRPALDFISDELLAPLDMQASGWQPHEDSRHASGHRWEDGRHSTEPQLPSGGDVAAFAGLLSSVRDLARWVTMLCDAWPPRSGPENWPLRRASLREMQRMWRIQPAQPASLSLSARAQGRADGYGYGLAMREQDGLLSAGHAGGLPGFGSHMRWAPHHGVGVILLGNVTYARLHDLAHELVADLARDISPRRRRPPVHAALLEARSGVERLLQGWDDALAGRLFADNLLLDRDAGHWQAHIGSLRERHGHLDTGGPLQAANALRGGWRIPAERGELHVWLTLAPTVPPRIQQLRIEGVLPPAGALQAAVGRVLDAMQAVDVLDEDVLGLPPGSPGNDGMLRELRLASLFCATPVRVLRCLEGDGQHSARLLLGGPQGRVQALIEVDAAGVPVRLQFEHDVPASPV